MEPNNNENERVEGVSGTEQPVVQSPATEGESSAQAPKPAAGDVSAHKLYAILGYILPFLFFLPLINDASKHNAFARFHANQHLILLIVFVGIYLLHNVLYMMFMFGGYFIMQLLNIAGLVFMIIGIINASKGTMKELPLIGGFKLID